ncbi:MAG: hypothetical protein NVV82_19395 [Sporocytophaga sp.]|nr:hypothetical protein [Sporocytophaga sp.]
MKKNNLFCRTAIVFSLLIALCQTNAKAQWAITGNSNITSSNFLGTTNAQPLIFKTNNTEVMRILSTGNIGIGLTTLNPYHKLTVSGNTNLIGTENVLQISSPNLGSNGARHYMYISNLTFSGQTNTQYTNLGTYEYNDSDPSIKRGKHLILQADAESCLGVGFFSTPPPARLSVNGNTFINGKVSVGSSYYMPIDYTFAVDGKIIATEVAVKFRNTWPDFVFEPTYKLQPLNEVETFVKANKHLPGVPSACEIEENGVVLGDMNAVLLSKIEELTLHLIAQQKLIEQQGKRIEELEKNK